jgi:hypothetical protein
MAEKFIQATIVSKIVKYSMQQGNVGVLRGKLPGPVPVSVPKEGRPQTHIEGIAGLAGRISPFFEIILLIGADTQPWFHFAGKKIFFIFFYIFT